MRVRTEYSFRAAVGKIDNVTDRLKEIEYPCAPITDRASTFGWVRWNKLCQKKGIRPVFGVELAVTPSINEKKPAVSHWTFIAIQDIERVNRLVDVATSQFRYEPLLSYKDAHDATGIVKIIGVESVVDSIILPVDEFTYASLSPSSSRMFIRKMAELGIPFVACSDNKFTLPDELPLYEVICGRSASVQSYSQWLMSDLELRAALKNLATEDQINQSFSNRNKIAELCQAGLKKAEMLKPEKLMSLRQMCDNGAKTLGIDLSDPIYEERLNRELDLIAQKDFEDYFYIIADLMVFARDNMICGPARGSSCGSLVCYLLFITTIDPIPYGLIFERFIDVSRNDLPDIDIDFSDEKRHLAFDYARQKYGTNRVARLGTVAVYKPRSAIGEAGAAMQVPKWKTDPVLESLIERSSGDSRALQAIEDTYNQTASGRDLIEEFPEMIIAGHMEGHARHYSQHAAGIVITERPILDFVAVDNRTGATMCDKKDAEELNLLKIDALGLTQLSVFEDALDLAGLPRHFLEGIPTDDKEAFDVLNQKKWSGVFQFNGLALQALTKQVRITHIEDIISITALARPGPLTSGGSGTWVQRKIGNEPVRYPHAEFKPYLEQTLGVVIYQEQVMEIGRKVGDLSWEDVTALRKAMSRSLGKEYFDQFGDKFKEGAIKKGIPKEVLDKVWDDLCAYGAWAFNRSHSVAYGLISYWCCWMKAHYPHEFAAATLSHEKDPARQIQTLRELNAEGVSYIPVDASVSTDKWVVAEIDGKKVLVGPVSNVKGIGPKIVSDIMSARARGEPLPDRARKFLANPTTPIDSLWPIRDAFHRILPNPAARNIHTPQTHIVDAVSMSFKQEFLFFCTLAKINVRDENETVIVARRGYEINDGKTTSLNLQLRDDTDTIFGKISRYDFPSIGKSVLDRGQPEKALYAVKGVMRENSGFRMVMIKNIRYIGTIDQQSPSQ